jgi:uncharacterized protein (DUF1778 family)
MPYSRQRPRIAPTGRVTIRLTPAQRDLFIHSAATPKNIGHLLHGAAVRDGKLSIRVNRESLEALIQVAAKIRFPDRGMERELSTLSRYLESLEDRFADA